MRLIIAFALLCVPLFAEEKKESPLRVPDDWQKFDYGEFLFYVPADVKRLPPGGIDSLVGKFESDDWRIQFDYGTFSNKLDDKTFTKKEVVIDKRSGHISTKENFMGVYLPHVYPALPSGAFHLNLCIHFKKDGIDPKLAETMLRSLEFPGFNRKVIEVITERP